MCIEILVTKNIKAFFVRYSFVAYKILFHTLTICTCRLLNCSLYVCMYVCMHIHIMLYFLFTDNNLKIKSLLFNLINKKITEVSVFLFYLFIFYTSG